MRTLLALISDSVFQINDNIYKPLKVFTNLDLGIMQDMFL